MNIKRLLNTPHGQILLSIVLGVGLASLFRKVCTDKNCITFNGPVLTDFDGKVYKHGEKCYKYTTKPDKCDSTKRVVDVGEQQEKQSKRGMF
jgi:hypothetical protein